MEPSFTGIHCIETHLVKGVRHVVDEFGWLSQHNRDVYRRCDEAFGRMAATVDSDDLWWHPWADWLDRLSVAQWLRFEGATPPSSIRAPWLWRH